MAEAPTKRVQAAAAAAPSIEEEDIVQRRTFRDYYIIIRERVWVALPLALLVSISLGYEQARVTPMYTSTATMQFEKPETVVTTQGVVDPSIRGDADLNTYLQVLTSSSRLRQRVVNSLTPDEQQVLIKPALKYLKPGEPPPSAASMLGGVSAADVGKSYIISVTATHPDPDAAALVANKFVEQFMLQLMDDVGGTNEDAVIWLQKRADELRHDSESADVRLEKYMEDKKLVSLEKDTDFVTARLQAANAAREQARLNLLAIQNVIHQIDDYKANHQDLLHIDEIAKSGNVATLRSQLADLNQQEATLSEVYGPKHPKMIAVEQNIEVVQDQLDHEVAHAVDMIMTRLAADETTVKTLEAEYAAREADEIKLRALTPEYNTLMQQSQVAKSNYQAIIDRLAQTTTTKNIEKIPIRPLDKATPNYAPYQPNMSRIMRTCIGVGILTFIGVAVGLSFIDDRIKSAWDVESFIGATLLGIIPQFPGSKGEERHTLMLENKQTAGIEAFLGVYSAIKINSKLDFPKALLITSTIPAEGKTLVSANLAACFARHGKRTLLIDCDLRRPMLHRHFKQQNTTGIITWFEKSGSVEGDLENNPHLGITKLDEHFWLLGSGGRSKSPTQMLENPIFGDLIEALKKQFDLVVVDSPPMGAVSDALLIAERVDEVVYVCRFNRAYRKHIRLYIRALLAGKNSVLGIVLNGLSPRRIEYYSNYRYYRSYKKYYGAQT